MFAPYRGASGQLIPGDRNNPLTDQGPAAHGAVGTRLAIVLPKRSLDRGASRITHQGKGLHETTLPLQGDRAPRAAAHGGVLYQPPCRPRPQPLAPCTPLTFTRRS